MAAMASMAPEQSINSQRLQYELEQIAKGFEDIMNNSDTTDGRSRASLQKKTALMTLSYNFNLGCGMLASVLSDDPRDLANKIASKTGSTINRWYDEMNEMDEMAAMIGYAMYDIINGCQQHTRGGGKRRYRQKGGAMLDRYDVFTMILLGGSAPLAISGLTAAGLNTSLVVRASNYVIDSVIDLAVKMGTFKAQCDSVSATSWNLLQRYTIGNFVPVETCMQKIQYNEAQITFIKSALSGLAVSLGSVTSYISAEHVGNNAKAVYRAVRENISKPVVDMIVERVSESGAAICNLATRRRDAASSNPVEVQQAAEAQAQSEVQAIDDLNEQIRNVVSSGGPLSSQDAKRIIAQLKKYAKPAAEERAMDLTEGGRRRRKRATRKSKMGKKSKTMKRGRKGKSKRKAHKSKKSRKTRSGTSRARR